MKASLTSAAPDSSPQQMLSHKQANSESQSCDANVVQQARDNNKRMLRRLFGRVAKPNSWPSSSKYPSNRPSPTFVVCGSVAPFKRQSADMEWRVQALHRAALSVATPLSTTEMYHSKVTDRPPFLSHAETVYSPASTYSSLAASCFTMSCETSSNSLSPISSSFPGHDLSSREQSQAAHALFLRQDTELLPRPASAQRALLSTEESLSVWAVQSAYSTLASLFNHEDDAYHVDHARALANRNALCALGGAKYFFQATSASKNPPYPEKNRSDNESSNDDEALRTPPPSRDEVWLSLAKDDTAVATKPQSHANCSVKSLWGVTTYAIGKKNSNIWGPIDLQELNRDACNKRRRQDRRLPTIPTPKPYDGTANQALFDRFVHESTRYLQAKSVPPENQVSIISEFLVGNSKTHRIYYDWLRLDNQHHSPISCLRPSLPRRSLRTFDVFVQLLWCYIFLPAPFERQFNGLSLVECTIPCNLCQENVCW